MSLDLSADWLVVLVMFGVIWIVQSHKRDIRDNIESVEPHKKHAWAKDRLRDLKADLRACNVIQVLILAVAVTLSYVLYKR